MHGRNQKTDRHWERTRVHGAPAAAVFVLALAVRLLYLYQSSAGPAFLDPLVDALTHHELAILVANGAGLEAITASYRSYFHPAFLSAIYSVTGPSVLTAKLIQALVGAGTCTITFALGAKLFGRGVGVAAGVITALYGPLFFWDGELVAASWAAFWSVTLILLFLHVAQGAGNPSRLLLGAFCALAVMTRPSFVPVIPLCTIWLVWTRARQEETYAALARELAVFGLGFVLVAAPAFTASWRGQSELRMTAASGGINLYIGNNDRRCDTINLRPGGELQEWVERVGGAGALTFSEKSSNLSKRFRHYVAHQPLDFIQGIGLKTLQYTNGREVPRNLDIYLFRDWSSLLAVSTWKLGHFGFPWGLLFPLALIGLIVRARDIPVPIWIFVVVQPVFLITVFVAGRQRVPIVPVLAVLAALAGLEWIRALRAGRRQRAAWMAAGVLGLMLLTSLHGPTCEEEVNYGSEFYTLLARRAVNLQEFERVEALLDAAISEDRTSYQANFMLGKLLRRQDRNEEALVHLDTSLAERTTSRALEERCRVNLRLKDFAAAEADCRSILELDPDSGLALLLLGDALIARGAREEAQQSWRRARALDRGVAPLANRRLRLERGGSETR